jgi:WD40 repeat protein/serine/threonine protein kinase
MTWIEKLRARTSQTAKQSAAALARSLPPDGQLTKVLRTFLPEGFDSARERNARRRTVAYPRSFTAGPQAAAPDMLPGAGGSHSASSAGTLGTRQERRMSSATRLAAELESLVVPLAVSDYAAGDVIAERFEVLQVLGRGAWFSVYLTRHRAWQIPLIVKAPLPEIVSSRSALRALCFDAAKWVDLGLHMHTAYCYQVRAIDHVPFLVVEHVDGGDLRSWMSGGRAGGLRVGLNLAIQICHGLEHAHAQGAWHGALTPENLLLTATGAVRVTDFLAGLRAAMPARLAGTAAGPRVAAHLEPYLAPEQWNDGADAGAQADIFSLGVCLYELLCGARPYARTDGPPAMTPEPRLAADQTPLPGALSRLLARCVAWETERRPMAVAQVRHELCAIYSELFRRPSPFEELSHHGWDADGWNNQALVALAEERFDEADAAWERALAADANHLTSIYNYGLTRWRRGDLTDDELTRELERVFTSGTHEGSASHLLALLHLERGDAATAIPLLEVVAATAPADASVHEVLAEARALAPPAETAAQVSTAHPAYLFGVCVAPDGRWTLTAGDDGALRFIDTAGGKLLRSLEGHGRRVSTVQLSPGGTFALSGGDDMTLRLWEVKTGRCLKTVNTPGFVFSVALDASGTRAVSASSGDKLIDDTWLQVWDLHKDRCLGRLNGHTSPAKAVALSADARRAVSGGDDHTVRVWDVGTLSCRMVLEGHEHYVSAVAMSADGRYAASGSWDSTIRLWDLNTWRCLRVFRGHQGIVTSVCLSADGRLVVSGSWDKSVRVWDADSGRCLRTFTGHTTMVTAVSLSTNGRTAASVSWDRTVRVWDVPQVSRTYGTLRLSVRPPAPALPSAELEPDELAAEAEAALQEHRVADALRFAKRLRGLEGGKPSSRTLRLWRQLSRQCTRTGLHAARKIGTLATAQTAAAMGLGATARRCLTADLDGRIRVWDVDLERCQRTLSGHGDRVLDVRLNPDETLAVSASADRTLRLWDLTTGECRGVLAGHESLVSSVALTPDLQWALSASYDHTLRWWALRSRECVHVLEGHTRQVTSVCLSADARFALSGSLDGTMLLWDLQAAEVAQTISAAPAGPVSAVWLTPDASAAVSANHDHTLRLWDLSSGECRRVWRGHTDRVAALTVSPDGCWIFSAGGDGSLRLWSLGDEEGRIVYQGGAPLTATALSPDASWLFAAGADRHIHVWELDWDLEVPDPAGGRTAS